MEQRPTPIFPDWLTALLPANIERYYVNVDGYRMHIMELGHGRPVLLLHGNPTWGLLYRRVAAALAGHNLRLIMPDLIGLGFSDKPHRAEIHQLVHHSHWIGALIDALGLEQLIFVGQDWGGPIGLHALSKRSVRVAGLVILNTVVGPPRPGFRPTGFHRLSQTPLISDAVFRIAGFPQNLLTLAQGDRKSMLGQIGRGYRYPLRHIRDRVAPLALARMVPDSYAHPSIEPLHECQAFIESYRGPAAIVWGDRDPILGRVRSHIERLLPHAEVTRTRAGHFLQEEVPDAIAAAILQVATRIDSDTQ